MRHWIVLGLTASLLWIGTPVTAQAYDPCATPEGQAMLAERRNSADRLRARHDMIMDRTVQADPVSVDCVDGILTSPLFNWAAGALGMSGLLSQFNNACSTLRDNALVDLIDRCFGIDWSSISLGGIDGFGAGFGETICGVNIGGGASWDGIDFDTVPSAPTWGGTGF